MQTCLRHSKRRSDSGDYREYLKSRGFSDCDIDAQVKFVETEGKRLQVERWNRILTAPTPLFNTKPNEFLVQMATNRQPGTALDVGMGQGRNAIWLAQQGWDVTGLDPAEQAVARFAIATAARQKNGASDRVDSEQWHAA